MVKELKNFYDGKSDSYKVKEWKKSRLIQLVKENKVLRERKADLEKQIQAKNEDYASKPKICLNPNEYKTILFMAPYRN